jgi:hypothetical protein
VARGSEKATDQGKLSVGKGGSKTKGSAGSFFGAGEELVKIDEAAENDLDSEAT